MLSFFVLKNLPSNLYFNVLENKRSEAKGRQPVPTLLSYPKVCCRCHDPPVVILCFGFHTTKHSRFRACLA